MTNFEDFWKEHGADYIAHIKSVALQDFNILNNTPLDKLVAHIEIGTDDDFALEGGDFFKVYGKNYKEVFKNTISFLKNIKFSHIPQWAKEADGTTKDSFSSKWYYIRDEAIKNLQEGETSISFGGNQTVNIQIVENKPSVSLEKLKNKF